MLDKSSSIKGGFLGYLLKRKTKIDFAIIGFPKCGTTSVQMNLLQMSSVNMPNHEVQIKKIINNAVLLSGKNENITGIKNPNLIYEKHNLKALYIANKNVKIIIGLRDPKEWLYSFFQYRKMEIKKRKSWLSKRKYRKEVLYLKDLSFSEFVFNKNSLLGVNADKGIYIRYILDVLEVFDEKNIFIYLLEDMAANPDSIYSKIYNFLEIHNEENSPRRIENSNYGRYEHKDKYLESIKCLEQYYSSYNERLNLVLKEKWGIENKYW